VTRPTVSVALATYQGARYVAEQLHSILQQSEPVDEIVIGDDGSTDGTLDVVRGILDSAANAPRVTLLEPTSRTGVAANFSRVLAATTGEIVVLCDQDDVWHVDRVSSALERFVADPALDLVFGDARLIDADGRDTGSTLFASLPLRASERFAIESGRGLDVFLRRNVATGATMSIRRRALVRALPVPAMWLHDEWIATTTALVGAMAIERRALVDYRQHGSNAVGVVAPTFAYKLRRVLAPRGERNRRLATAFAQLADWTETAVVSSAARTRVRRKSTFEARRAALPSRRLARVPRMLMLAPEYPSFASQGALDILRDLLQPS